jgi:hypothetical protein
MNFKKIFSYPVIPFLILAIVSLIILSPLFYPGFPVTDDGTWMIIRLSAFYQSLSEGQFPVRYLGRLNHNYGYPVSNFLYPGFLYIGSIIKLVGFTFVDSIKIIIGGCVFGSAIFTYLWLKKYFGLVNALISSFSIITAPYLLFDIYKRGSVGEILAIFCITIILYAISRSYNYLAAFIFGLLIVSHNTIALFFVIFFILYIIIYRRRDLFKILFIALGLAAFFWIPALVEKQYVRFDTLKISDPLQYTIGSKYIYLLPILTILAGIYSFIFRKKYHASKTFIHILVLFIFSLLIASPLSSPLWSNIRFAQLIQFPYRILVVSLFCGSWMVALFLSIIPKSYKLIAIIGSVLLMVFQSSYIFRNIQIQRYEEGYYTTNEATTTVSDEYMPIWVSKIPLVRAISKIEVVSGSVSINPIRSSSQSLIAQLDVATKSRIQINAIYYPGWGIVLNDLLQNIEFNNSYGLMQFEVPEGKFTLKAEFRETGFRFIADCISLFSFIILIVLTVINYKNNYFSRKYA